MTRRRGENSAEEGLDSIENAFRVGWELELLFVQNEKNVGYECSFTSVQLHL